MADGEAQTPAAKKSDLGVRTLSAIVMLAIAGAAFWLGGAWFDGFIALIAVLGVSEMARMVVKAGFGRLGTILGMIIGAAYIGLAAWLLIDMQDMVFVAIIMLLVIIADVSAYFAGRQFGKRRIAPSISPSKTWAGLFGAMVGCGLFLMLVAMWISAMAAAFSTAQSSVDYAYIALAGVVGALLAVLAQAGDFLESWLKRRAGVKDSSNLIPGHGGVFDRIDGLIPVAIAAGLLLQAAPM